MQSTAVKTKFIIESRGLKQKYVAEKAGFTPADFNNLLCGRKLFKADYVIPICNALGVTPNELFEPDSNPKETKTA